MKLVPYEGPTDAKIYIVGEAPGVEEEATGRPFVGGAGRILNKMLMDVGISRSECRIANVMRVRPPNNDFSHFYVDKKFTIPKVELEEGRRYLREDIKKCKPNVVVLLGNEALAALFGHRGITDWRGSILYHTRLGVKCIPTIHPAMVMRQWNFAPLVLFDLRRVRDESETPEYVIPHRDFILAPTFEQTMEELDRLSRCKRIAFDVETTGTMISAIAFADSPFSAISIPFTYSKGVKSINIWSTEEEMAILEKVKELMEDEKVEKIAQNAQFDCMVFAINPPGITVRNLILDTMCAHTCVYPELPKGLDVLCSIYTRQPYYKHWAKRGNDVDFWKYNAMDACVTYEASIAIEKELTEFGVRDFYYRVVHPLIPILMEMQMRGVRINQTARLQGAAECAQQVDKAQVRLNELVGREVNVMSPKQLKQLLYEDMHLPSRISRITGRETTDKEALEVLASQYPNEIFDLILLIRKNRKLLGTYLTDEGERIRCSYVIGGTETGRLSSRESIFGTGCLLPTAEVLTPFGWRRFDELGEYAEVMQWDTNGKLSFCNAKVWKFPFEGKMIEAYSDFHRCVYTPEHRIPYLSYHTSKITTSISGKVYEAHAQVFATFNTAFLPVSGYYNGKLSFPNIRLLVMIQADGTFDSPSYVRLSFNKERKIKRCLHLLEESGVEYYEISAKEGFRRFVVKGKVIEEIYGLLGKHKLYDSWVFRMSNGTLNDLLDEVKYWDGHIRGKSFMYFTGVEQNAAVISTLAHLCGHSASSIRKQPSKEYIGGKIIPGRYIYTVVIKPRCCVQSKKSHFRKYPYKGDVYCVTTDTAYFLVRYKDRIMVTGNTNLQNIPKGVCRKMFVPDEGKVFIEADLSQAEARVVAYLSGEEKLISLFEQGGDIYRQVAGWIYEKDICAITKEEREMAKRLVHASNYGIRSKTFAHHAGIKEGEAKVLLQKYFDTFPKIKAWQLSIQAHLSKSRVMETPMGRKRMFFGRWGEQLFREAYSYQPQSTVADVLNLALIRLKQRKPEVEVMLQVHDSFLLQCNKNEVDGYVGLLKDVFNIPLHIHNRVLVIPVEIKMGLNWDEMKVVGLLK